MLAMVGVGRVSLERLLLHAKKKKSQKERSRDVQPQDLYHLAVSLLIPHPLKIFFKKVGRVRKSRSQVQLLFLVVYDTYLK